MSESFGCVAPHLPTAKGSALSAFELFDELINSDSVQRLGRIRFLGAIEFFSNARSRETRTAGSRLEHTIGTAELAIAAASAAKLPHQQLLLIVVHALLHDIGHGPFSHSSEEFFERKYKLNHHVRFEELLADESTDVVKILRRHKVLSTYRSFVGSPTRFPTFESFFYGPLNVDTVEGITRAAEYFGLSPNIKPADLAQFIAKPKISRVAIADRFWNLKSEIYGEHINTPASILLDSLVTEILTRAKGEVEKSDFYLTDDEFESKYHGLINEILLEFSSRECADRKLKKPARVFEIDARAFPKKLTQFALRYSQHRLPL